MSQTLVGLMNESDWSAVNSRS